MKRLFSIFLMTGILQVALLAQIPRTLSYQGMLTDAVGNPKPDATYSFTFKLYDSTNAPTPIWEETKTLQVTKGLFSTSLGDANPFGAAVKFDKQYWLGIKVGNEAELTPRIVLNSVAYSLNASLADTTWVRNGSNLYFLNGNVGIGNTNPRRRLQIDGDEAGIGLERFIESPNAGVIRFGDNTKWKLHFGRSKENPTAGLNEGEVGLLLTIRDDGNVGIGNSYPRRRLQIGSEIEGIGFERFISSPNAGVIRFGDNTGWKLHFGRSFESPGAPVNEGEAGLLLTITDKGNVGLGTSNPSARLEVAGRTKTQVLEITGGSDLAEPFEITNSEMLEPGSAVVIDEYNPGKLKLSSKPYDKRVAGVVSGAGGVQPGLTLKQEGVMEGNQNIALTGRVYVKTTTENGAITPGDLLTTSSLTGHVMKATDESKSHGTIIGKAMSSLNEGTGLVLVLVNLQ